MTASSASASSNSAIRMTPATIEVDETTAFIRVTEGLLSIGAALIPHYLNDLPTLSVVQITPTSPVQPPQPVNAPEPEHTLPNAVRRIHQACQHTFGNIGPLKFEFEEDVISRSKRCTLTITRPNGTSHTYTSSAAHVKNYDAKSDACTMAIENGALDFIHAGESNAGASTSTASAEPSTAPLDMDESVKAIEQCCLERGGGRIKPFWLNINEPKLGRTQGCALRIRLGPRNVRVYSVNTIYHSPAEARKACAEAALAEGVLDYIKSWSPSDAVVEDAETQSTSSLTLQQFFDSLPQPFPEPIGGRNAVDINGPAWLNTTIQSARGGKLVPNFVWTGDPTHALHGCLLRLERPGEVKSYLVDARFLKRVEAKAAVCLLAMSEGVGDYIREVGRAVENKIAPTTRRHITEVLLPKLNAEYRKVHGPGIQPTFEYDQELDACGATMTIELASNSSPQQTRKYTVPAEYRNRNDAKLAVVLHAIEQGAIEFLRFRGNLPPPGYVSDHMQAEAQYMNRKRKTWDTGGGHANANDGGEWSGHSYGRYSGAFDGGSSWQNKKPRVGGGYQGNFSGGQVQGGGHGYHNGSSKAAWNGGQKKRQQYQQNWMVPRAPDPGHFGEAAGNAYTANQFKPGPRNVGMSSRVQQQHHLHQFSTPVSVPIPIFAPYTGVTFPMQPQQQQGAPAPAPAPAPPVYPPYSVSGAAAGGVEPARAAYYGAVPQAQQMQAQVPHRPQPQVQTQVAPYGAPPPGVIAYPSAYAQSQTYTTPVQYPLLQQQQQHGAAAYTPIPGLGQVPGYQQYPSAPSQPVLYPTAVPAPSSTSTSLSSSSTVTPAAPAPHAYYTVAGTAPANNPIAHDPSGLYAAYQPPPVPPQPPVPTTPAVQPPPPPPTVAPPPPPPTTAPPPPPPSTSIQPTISQLPPTPVADSSPATPSQDAAKSTNDWPTMPRQEKKPISIESAPKTNVMALYDFCRTAGMDTPQWCHEIVKNERQHGSPKHKVWVVIGKMKFELPVTFSSISQGQEKIAKKVADQLRAQNKSASHEDATGSKGKKP